MNQTITGIIKRMSTSKILGKQFIKYCLVGTTGTSLDLLVLYFLVEYCHLFYLLAAIISAILAIVLNFTLNKFWTFRDRDGSYFTQLFRYVAAHAVGGTINFATLILLVEIFGVWYLSARVAATLAAFFWNFLATKKWVFRPSA